MKPTGWRVAIQVSVHRQLASLFLTMVMTAGTSTFADGCFVFHWNKQKDINEPTQKAIILYDGQQEDLVLQVKYEGPAEDFGWVVPVPGQPHVRKGSMQPFYELSRLTQEHFGDGTATMNEARSKGDPGDHGVKVIEVKTIGAYEVAILSGTNPSALADWLAAHGFDFPKEKQNVLAQYIQRHWYFVAARINPDGDGFVVKPPAQRLAGVSSSTRRKLAAGELHPIVISFPSEKCLFPLAISSVNGTASEISLYVLAIQPLLSPVIFERKLKAYKGELDQWLAHRDDRRKSIEEMRARVFRDSPAAARITSEDPGDPPPPNLYDRPGLGVPERDLSEDPEDFYSSRLQPVQSMLVEGDADSLKACRHDLPRVKGKKWWLTKLVETFRPEEMVDLEFEPAIPYLVQGLHREDGDVVAHCLPQYGALAAPVVLQALDDPDAALRKRALLAAAEITDSRFVDPVLKLIEEKDPQARKRACYASARNWDPKFAAPLMRLVSDPNRETASAAQYCLREHLSEATLDSASLRKLLAQDSPASLIAFQALERRNAISRDDLRRALSSTNLPVVSSAFSALRTSLTPDELTPLMTNSLPMARMMALGALVRVADKPAVDRIVSMLRDPSEVIRWRVRSVLRRLTGQKLGADPAAYEKWWAENRQTYAPPPLPRRFGAPERRRG